MADHPGSNNFLPLSPRLKKNSSVCFANCRSSGRIWTLSKTSLIPCIHLRPGSQFFSSPWFGSGSKRLNTEKKATAWLLASHLYAMAKSYSDKTSGHVATLPRTSFYITSYGKSWLSVISWNGYVDTKYTLCFFSANITANASLSQTIYFFGGVHRPAHKTFRVKRSISLCLR